MLLQKRAKAKKEFLNCEDDDKTKKKVTYTRFAYPGASQWPITFVQVREAIVVVNADGCTETKVHERQATAEELQPGENNSPPKINSKGKSAKTMVQLTKRAKS
jgi:hypothetical protein